MALLYHCLTSQHRILLLSQYTLQLIKQYQDPLVSTTYFQLIIMSFTTAHKI